MSKKRTIKMTCSGCIHDPSYQEQVQGITCKMVSGVCNGKPIRMKKTNACDSIGLTFSAVK